MRVILPIVLFSLLGMCIATQVILYPTIDSYLDSSNPTTNYGSVSQGYVYQDPTSGATYTIVLLINIYGLPSTIVSATLTYQQEYECGCELLGPYCTTDVYEIATNWTESAVTYNNPPIVLRSVLSGYQDNDIYNVIVPITSIVQSGISNGKTYVGVQLQSSSPVVSVFMREATIQDRPYIIVTY